MEQRVKPASLIAFVRSQLRPLIIVVLVYAILENLWIYYMPGNQFVPPYFCLFIYNLLLIWSTWLLCVKNTPFYNRFNMFMIYFFTFACEIFNTARLKDFIKKDEFIFFRVITTTWLEPGVDEYNFGIDISRLAFFLYAVHVRSNCLEFLRGSSKTHHRPTESLEDFLKNLRPSEAKIPKSKIRLVLLILVAIAVLVSWLEVYLVMNIIDYLHLNFLIATLSVFFNAVVVFLTLALYWYPCIGMNIASTLVAYSSFWLSSVVFLLRLALSKWPDRSHADAVIGGINCAFFLTNGIFFVWTVYTHSLLLEDSGYLTSARRIFTYFKFRKTSVQPTDIDAASKQAEKMKTTKYGSI